MNKDMMKQFICFNLRDCIAVAPEKRSGEKSLEEKLSAFSCPQNPDVESFLKKNAIEFTKKHQSITYLLFSIENMELVGYFSITMKPVTIKTTGMSNTIKKKLSRVSRFDEKTDGYHVAAYLIAQLGRNYDTKLQHPVSGKILMDWAIEILQGIQYSLGGLVVYLECEEKEKLLRFYQEQNHFKRFAERTTENAGETEPHRLVQLMSFL